MLNHRSSSVEQHYLAHQFSIKHELEVTRTWNGFKYVLLFCRGGGERCSAGAGEYLFLLAITGIALNRLIDELIAQMTGIKMDPSRPLVNAIGEGNAVNTKLHDTDAHPGGAESTGGASAVAANTPSQPMFLLADRGDEGTMKNSGKANPPNHFQSHLQNWCTVHSVLTESGE